MLHGWYPRVVQLLGLGHTGATGQRAQYGKSGKSTGEHWQALATIGLGRAGAAELLGEAGAGQGTARSDRWHLAWQHKWLLPERFRPLTAFAQNLNWYHDMLYAWYPRVEPCWCGAGAVRVEHGVQLAN